MKYFLLLILLLTLVSATPTITMKNKTITKCSTDIGTLSFSIPFWNWSGITMNNGCSELQTYKWFFSYKEVNNQYTWTGIRLYIIFSIILIISLIYKIKAALLAERMMY